MIIGKIQKQMLLQNQAIANLKNAQKNADTRLGDINTGSSPRGFKRWMDEIRERVEPIFDVDSKMEHGRSGLEKLIVYVRNIIRRISGRPMIEQDPREWPPSWPVLVPLHSDLSRVWKQRFSQVMEDVENLKKEMDKRTEEIDLYKSEQNQLPERARNTRRIELGIEPIAESKSSLTRKSIFSRVFEFLSTWSWESLFGSRKVVFLASEPEETKVYIVTLDKLLKEDIGRPKDATKIDEVRSQIRGLLKSVDDDAKGIA
jgi:hypothetical protein